MSEEIEMGEPIAFNVKYEESEWECYLFGNKPDINDGIIYVPAKGNVPNWFIRLMMKWMLGCTWVKKADR